MTPESVAEIAARVGDARAIVLIAGDDVAMETGIEPRPERIDWDVYGPRMRAIDTTPPGPAHLGARRLQDGGRLQCVITYGDDVFFEQAGVRNVIALRGSVELSLCTGCGYSEPLSCLVELLPTPRCAACGGEMRPDVVPPGEAPSAERVADARTAVSAAGLLLIAGSVPGSDVADLAVPRGTQLIDVGNGHRLATIADLVERDDEPRRRRQHHVGER
jgi:NAD-dependent deacetylase